MNPMLAGADLGDIELQRILAASYAYWMTELLPAGDRLVCYSWVVGKYADRFGGRFHPSKLQRLARLGFLEKVGTSRGGSRRYYRIVDATGLRELLEAWSLN
jgi:hypothetical protein